ncbi:hypothetical protein CCACVL1_17578 [Corchorus capsularis]|uniref:Uncharacterized protein n=1 Tax=Corchorus capsularis TaxID=210143 RepID=A0A1R3HR98_COCAP|nr:hypothetical protein CCACVL1_17578 [Corchorus capsularis]
MGCRFSSRSSCRVKNTIRVVHLSGYIEDFEYPVSVSQVTGGSRGGGGGGRPPKHFLCTPTQLISNGCKGLEADTILEAGHIYFLLPYSTLQAEVSPLDLASIAKKLTAKAKSTKCNKPNSLSASSMNSLATSPNRFIIKSSDSQRPTRRLQAWRPILDTIREKSFNRRSESDLQET